MFKNTVAKVSKKLEAIVGSLELIEHEADVRIANNNDQIDRLVYKNGEHREEKLSARALINVLRAR